jgi:hypothetical protein
MLTNAQTSVDLHDHGGGAGAVSFGGVGATSEVVIPRS